MDLHDLFYGEIYLLTLAVPKHCQPMFLPSAYMKASTDLNIWSMHDCLQTNTNHSLYKIRLRRVSTRS
jgi:hypothetical protein